MHCPHCGSEHNFGTPCKPENERKPEAQKPEEKHPLAGLDNPFWKPEKVAKSL